MEEAEIRIGEVMGEEGFAKLVAAFYRRIPEDDLLGPMYPEDDLVAAESRLRGFLIYRFGIADRYIRERGHPRLRMRHAPFSIGKAERDRWLLLMSEAMRECEVPDSISTDLWKFLEHVADFMRNR